MSGWKGRLVPAEQALQQAERFRLDLVHEPSYADKFRLRLDCVQADFAGASLAVFSLLTESSAQVENSPL